MRVGEGRGGVGGDEADLPFQDFMLRHVKLVVRIPPPPSFAPTKNDLHCLQYMRVHVMRWGRIKWCNLDHLKSLLALYTHTRRSIYFHWCIYVWHMSRKWRKSPRGQALDNVVTAVRLFTRSVKFNNVIAMQDFLIIVKCVKTWSDCWGTCLVED